MDEGCQTTESSVGISCYINKGPVVGGLIKARYSDFHVHEIGRNGEVAYLTNESFLPPEAYPAGFEDWIKDRGIFFEFEKGSDNQIAQIFYNYTDVSISVEGKRVHLERTFKKKYHPQIFSAILCKENISEQEALRQLSQKLGVTKADIGFAGNKDKRGITTQNITIKGTKAQNIQNVLGKFEGFKIGHVGLAMTPLSLGDLSGNRFTIAIRNVSIKGLSSEDYEAFLSQRMTQLESQGFINYYGMQRFGTGEVPTHDIGRMILKRKFKEIIQLILSPLQSDNPRLSQAKKVWRDTGNASEAVRLCPKTASAEHSLFKALESLPPGIEKTEPLRLFQCIERRMRMMYVHAYQSYLWNHAASTRWKEGGSQLLVGDMVMTDTDEIIEISQINKNNYTIFDVVIPLPNGVDCSPIMAKIMQSEGVTQEMFLKVASEYGSKGDWRKLLSKPGDLKWELIRHSSMEEPLIDSDIDRIENRTCRDSLDPNGSITSLILEFSLKSGQYATMLMRELLKRSTEWFTDAEMTKPKKKSFISSLGCSVQ